MNDFLRKVVRKSDLHKYTGLRRTAIADAEQNDPNFPKSFPITEAVGHAVIGRMTSSAGSAGGTPRGIGRIPRPSQLKANPDNLSTNCTTSEAPWP
jgi:hypothetical protein